MLNQNVYSAIKKQQEQSKKITGERERLRNNIIDETGYKPDTKELNSLLAAKATKSVLKGQR